jgi:CSLREA domain-containing protein
MRRFLVSFFVVSMLLAGASVAPVVGASPDRSIRVSVPRAAAPGRAFAVTVNLPSSVAAVDGRVYVRAGAAELLGVAPVGRGTALRPVAFRDGAAFGAYGLRPTGDSTVLRLVFVPHRAGRIQIRVVIDATADRQGRRTAIVQPETTSTVAVGQGSRLLTAPPSTARPVPSRTVGTLRELERDGRVDRRDLDVARVEWESARLAGTTCRPAALDANADGCRDIVDLQVTLAAKGTSIESTGTQTQDIGIQSVTFLVNSPGDTPDASPGNGTCADALGLCTLRAALTEANWTAGEDRINFALPGPAPARIQLVSGGPRLPLINSRNGGVFIDGYSQPGSRVNDAPFGSNAIQGVEIRGNGQAARETPFFITSAGNTVRGLLIQNVWRAIFIDGPDAHDNRVIGNWIGFQANGANASASNGHGVSTTNGASNNVIGTPALADRNVIGNHNHGLDFYGPGTNGNVVQNNQVCITPSGLGTATCGVGIDHNFGPKGELIGGSGANERNVFGPTNLNGIEFSHGWDPDTGASTTTWQINDHRVIGNWIGFRGDGRYNISFRSGLGNQGTADNGNGVNVYDGSNDNLVEGNFIASRWDGVQVMMPNALRNTVRGNTIGVSPLGEAAPLTGWGIKIRIGTRFDVIEGNTIRNAALGGIGLIQSNVQNIRVSRNIVNNTNGPGIELYGVPGPDPNDPGDGDSGANTLLNTPVVTSATTSIVAGSGLAGARVEVFRASRPAGQFGLPIEFLGSVTVAQNGTWSLPVTIAAGERVTALQIRSNDDTSELSVNVAVGAAPPPPEPGDLLAADDFERSGSNGWGTATLGGQWSHSINASDYSVDGEGRMSIASGRTRASSIAIETADVSITGETELDRLPVSGTVYMYVVARSDGATAYNGQVRVAPDGNAFARLRRVENGTPTALGPEVALPGLTLTPGAPLEFRFEVVGTEVRFRLWAPGDPEPGAWQLTATDGTPALQDAGSAGVQAYVGSGVSNGPVVVSWDDFEVRHG